MGGGGDGGARGAGEYPGISKGGRGAGVYPGVSMGVEVAGEYPGVSRGTGGAGEYPGVSRGAGAGGAEEYMGVSRGAGSAGEYMGVSRGRGGAGDTGGGGGALDGRRKVEVCLLCASVVSCSRLFQKPLVSLIPDTFEISECLKKNQLYNGVTGILTCHITKASRTSTYNVSVGLWNFKDGRS